MTAQEISTRQMVELPQMTALQKALLASGVPILDEADVEKFKSKKLLSEKWEAIRAIVFFAAITCALAVLAYHLLGIHSEWAFGCGVFCCVGAFLSMLTTGLGISVESKAGWMTFSYPDDGPMCPSLPWDVIRKIDTVQNYMRGLQLEVRVESLYEDPALYLLDEDGSKYYIAIWD
jgi:hypothetical protein